MSGKTDTAAVHSNVRKEAVLPQECDDVTATDVSTQRYPVPIARTAYDIECGPPVVRHGYAELREAGREQLERQRLAFETRSHFFAGVNCEPTCRKAPDSQTRGLTGNRPLYSPNASGYQQAMPLPKTWEDLKKHSKRGKSFRHSAKG
ncbi:hypothetical protein [Paraburkholderia strydomiana]|uniref:hypothetical protein n=1 Tax=Paraburkholderia strydomiana TaxID=1245417 RepID=UPI001BE7749D|nr:hypothetical protein [Paraburkholderia strydomiana]MBT2792841.1 hypothetical protein [Paraburkholderia strydomiana]